VTAARGGYEKPTRNCHTTAEYRYDALRRASACSVSQQPRPDARRRAAQSLTCLFRPDSKALGFEDGFA